MKIRLFHKIGEQGADSAEIRRFIVENGLVEMLEFSNVAHESSQKELRELTSDTSTPALSVDGNVIHGKTEILDWLKTNLLRLRD